MRPKEAGMPWFRTLVPEAHYHQPQYAEALWPALPECGTWLDLGAGSRIHGGWLGHGPEALRQRVRTLVGVDLVAPHLRQHPHLTGGALAEGETLPFRDGSVDLVSANMVLEHLTAPASVFREVARVLRPGGAFVFVTPNRAHPVIRLLALLLRPGARRLLARVVESGRGADRVFLTHYRANRVLDLLQLGWETGLNVERLVPFSSLPMFPRLPPLLALEAAWIRWFARPGGWYPEGGSNLLGVMRRAVETHSPAGSRRDGPPRESGGQGYFALTRTAP
ncbi:MAG: class I SAM-dependent methyltransferase [Gemmatimonadetes bacterium]|nr:class I SAM-dependent methyltransferase [Gemmatimonadota bacterium]